MESAPTPLILGDAQAEERAMDEIELKRQLEGTQVNEAQVLEEVDRIPAVEREIKKAGTGGVSPLRLYRPFSAAVDAWRSSEPTRAESAR